MLALPLALLASLASLTAASPLPDGARLLPRAESKLITWRGKSSRNQLAAIITNGPFHTGPSAGIGLRERSEAYGPTEFAIVGAAIRLNVNKAENAKTKCVDSTLNPGNGARPHMWDCYPGAWQQSWVIHSNGWIELRGTGMCLDVTDGNPEMGIQLWECAHGNINQQFDIGPWHA